MVSKLNDSSNKEYIITNVSGLKRVVYNPHKQPKTSFLLSKGERNRIRTKFVDASPRAFLFQIFLFGHRAVLLGNISATEKFRIQL